MNHPALVASDFSVGVELPAFAIPLTLQRLVMEAGVNRDFTPTHHDRDLAARSGAPAPYANTPFVVALVEAAVRQWIGGQGRLLELDVRIRHFNRAGTTLEVGGVVTAVGPLGDLASDGLDPQGWTRVDATMWIDAGDTRNVDGTVIVAVPRPVR